MYQFLITLVKHFLLLIGNFIPDRFYFGTKLEELLIFTDRLAVRGHIPDMVVYYYME